MSIWILIKSNIKPTASAYFHTCEWSRCICTVYECYYYVIEYCICADGAAQCSATTNDEERGHSIWQHRIQFICAAFIVQNFLLALERLPSSKSNSRNFLFHSCRKRVEESATQNSGMKNTHCALGYKIKRAWLGKQPIWQQHAIVILLCLLTPNHEKIYRHHSFEQPLVLMILLLTCCDCHWSLLRGTFCWIFLMKWLCVFPIRAQRIPTMSPPSRVPHHPPNKHIATIMLQLDLYFIQ